VASASLVVTVIQALLIFVPIKHLRARWLGYQLVETVSNSPEPHNVREHLHKHISAHGGGLIFAFQIARLGSALLLFALALATMLLKQDFEWENIALVFTIVSHITL
jgi:hypothetical protein